MRLAYLTNEQVMQLPYKDLVRYCDSLLDPDAALDILVNALDPPHIQPRTAEPTHCRHGHEYPPDAPIHPSGRRECRECRREQKARRAIESDLPTALRGRRAAILSPRVSSRTRRRV